MNRLKIPGMFGSSGAGGIGGSRGSPGLVRLNIQAVLLISLLSNP
jgi:hypothetical protein